MRYVVTGGAGMIGSRIVRDLSRAGHDVTAVDDLSRGAISNLSGAQGNVRFVKADITDYVAIRKHLEDADGIFHQAALAHVPDSFERALDYHRVNVIGTRNVFEIALKAQARVVFASSGSVYEDTSPARPIRETCPLDPASPYAWTKQRGEAMVARYGRAGARIVVLRYFNVVGPGRDLKHAGAIHKMAHAVANNSPPRIFGDGRQVRDFVHVDDVVRANVAAMDSGMPYGVFNIGSGKGVSIGDLACMVVRTAGIDLEPVYEALEPGGVGSSVASISKARRHLGWAPKITLEECVREALSFFSSAKAPRTHSEGGNP